MRNFYVMLMVCVFAFAKANSQVVINELDADTPGTNDKQFVELLTPQPFTELDDYVLVFFNGNPNSSTTGNGRSYYAVDLDGLETDFNGLVVLGSSKVVPAVDRRLAESNIQLGADAVAIYRGSTADFPDRTFATQDNLIDALVYDTSDPDNQPLLSLLGEQEQYNENENGKKTTESIQRKADGTYETKAPTPHSFNDTDEPSFIGVDFTLDPEGRLDEGQDFDIIFTLTKPADQDITLTFSLSNDGFNTNDFTGPTSVSFAEGETTKTLSYSLIDDQEDEGDEFLRVNLGNSLPVGYKRLRDNEETAVIDNDFVVATYGTPLNPTYGVVASTQPDGYYNDLEGKSGDQLEQAITNLIAETGVVRIHSYDDVTTILKDADASPTNSNKVWLMYTEQERRDIDFQTGSNNQGTWNREHIYSRSRGNFFSIEDIDEVADGIDEWIETSVDSTRHGNSDAHHLRATDGPENSSRGNQDYPEYNGPERSQGSWHGDVARAMFYMALRYNDVDIVRGNPDNSTVGEMGDLDVLLQWNEQDPPDDFEMNRNNVIYEWQRNRNPFIDNPELANFIWGEQAGSAYTLSNDNVTLNKLTVYPNPSNGSFYIKNVESAVALDIYDALGRITYQTQIERDTQINTNLSSGIYLVRVSGDYANRTFKLIIE